MHLFNEAHTPAFFSIPNPPLSRSQTDLIWNETAVTRFVCLTAKRLTRASVFQDQSPVESVDRI